MSKDKPLRIRNSTAEFLIFTRQAGEEGIEVQVAEETVWLTQKLMTALFEVDVRTVSEHSRNVFESGEQREDSVVRKIRITAADGKSYSTQHYNLAAIIAVGFRVNSARAIQFRQWATGVLRKVKFEKYRVIQDRLFESDFDRAIRRFARGKGELARASGRLARGQARRARGQGAADMRRGVVGTGQEGIGTGPDAGGIRRNVRSHAPARRCTGPRPGCTRPRCGARAHNLSLARGAFAFTRKQVMRATTRETFASAAGVRFPPHENGDCTGRG